MSIGTRQTVKSRCPVCGGVLPSMPTKYGVKAMTICKGCSNLLEVDVEIEPQPKILYLSEACILQHRLFSKQEVSVGRKNGGFVGKYDGVLTVYVTGNEGCRA